MKTTEQIQAELESLQAELSALNSRYNEIDSLKKKLADEQKELLDRHKELVGRDVWGSNLGGLIGKVNRELLESQRPIYETNVPTSILRSGCIPKVCQPIIIFFPVYMVNIIFWHKSIKI